MSLDKNARAAHEDYLDCESARIKNIYIKLPEYEYFHSPSGISRKDKRLIGRKKVKNKLKTILRNSKTKAGAYLVTGYRGMGKTSLVREVIADLKADDREKRVWLMHLGVFSLAICSGIFFRGLSTLVQSGMGFSNDFWFPWKKSADLLTLDPFWIVPFSAILFFHFAFVGVAKMWNPFRVRKRKRSEDQAGPEKASQGRYSSTKVIFEWLVDVVKLWIPVFLIYLSFVAPQFKVEGLVWVSSAELGSGPNPLLLGILFVGIGGLYGAMFFYRTNWLNIFFRKFPGKAEEVAYNTWDWIFPKSSKNLTTEIEISLSQDDIGEIDFLRLLAKKLQRVYHKFSQPIFSYLKTIRFIRFWTICAILYFALLPHFTNLFYGFSSSESSITMELSADTNLANQESVDLNLRAKTESNRGGGQGIWHRRYWPIFSILVLLLVLLISVYGLSQIHHFLASMLGVKTHRHVRERLAQLVSKIDTSVTLEKNRGVLPSVAQIGWFQLGRKQTQQYPVAGTKEIEFELIDILDEIDAMFRPWGHKPRFICVFDELDKIQLDFASPFDEENESNTSSNSDREFITRRLRERREKISNILANLKHFLNVAKAKFVFIAGREMFDASLADISDRDFFLGSIFHDIVYVDSFLKDQASSNSYGLTNMIEKYVCRFLIGDLSNRNNSVPEPQRYSLEAYYNILKEVRNKQLEFRQKEIEDQRESQKKLSKLKSPGQDELEQIELRHHFRKQLGPFNKIIALLESAIEQLLESFHKTGLKIKTYNQEKYSDHSKTLSEIKVELQQTKTLLGKFEEQLDELMEKFSAERQGYFETKEKYFLANQKVLAVLQNFIIYLVYRSNGTPKKVTNLFEKYIVEQRTGKDGKKELNLNSKRDLIIPRKPNPKNTVPDGFYLAFDYNDQYTFSLISYLFRPHLISTSQYMKSFGDKLLFSTSFLIDHIFKFHPWAFSWRTLELTPELVFASKSPELRSFIGTLMGSLMRTHIREVVYGVFEFKFYNKTRHEISYISKIREEESAAFNFTLDESRHIKVHFQKRIQKMVRQYRNHPARREGEYYHSLAFLYSTLGDIYYYDQEFDEALISYSEAVAIYNSSFPDEVSPHQLTNWMKDRLKMGLAYEKMRSNDDAFSKYEGLLMDLDRFFGLRADEGQSDSEEKRAEFAKALFENLRFFQLPFVAKLVLIEKEGISGISYRDIKNNEMRMRRLLKLSLGRSEKWSLLSILSSSESKETQEFLVRTYYHLNVGSVLYFKNGAVIHARDELEPEDLNLWKSLSRSLGLSGENPRDQKPKSQRFRVPRSAIIEYYKSFLFLLARLQAFSNDRGHSIKNEADLTPSEIEKEAFSWISRQIDSSISEMESSLGGKISFDGLNDPNDKAEKLQNARFVLERIQAALTQKKAAPNATVNNPFLLVFACSVWFYYLEPKDARFINKDKNLMATISLILSKLGDCILCAVDSAEISLSEEKWTYLFDVRRALLLQPTYSKNSLGPLESISLSNWKKEDFIYFSSFLYLMSAQFYLKAGGHQNYEFQLRKILYLIKEYSSFGATGEHPPQNAKSFTDLLISELIGPSLKGITWANETTNRPQIFKYKSVFGIADESNPYESKYIYQYLSNYPETKETILLMAEIELKLFQQGKLNAEDVSFPLNRPIGNPYSNYPTKFVRMQELNFKAQFNFSRLFRWSNAFEKKQGGGIQVGKDVSELARQLIKKYLKDVNFLKDPYLVRHFNLEEVDENDFPQKLVRGERRVQRLENILGETLFCLVDVIKILEIFGINYMTNHSYLGFSHAKLGDWCLLYQAYIKNLSDASRKAFQVNLRQTVEASNISYLEPKYHYEKATRHLYSAIGMHNNGKDYYQQLQEMFFLEDDFNDNMYHFSAALERYKINIGAIEKKIRALKAFKNLSKTFRYDSYVNKETFE